MSEQQLTAPDAGVQVFSFGDPEPVLDGREVWGAFGGLWQSNQWYEPPLPMLALAKAFKIGAVHRSAIKLKVNMLARHFEPSRWLSEAEHKRAVLDYLQMGNLFVEKVPSLARTVLDLKVSPALHTRVGVEEGRYFWVRPSQYGFGSADGAHEFASGTIIHLKEDDTEQEVYGLPEWLGALQSLLLNENAKLFRRRYYLNGAHAGFVFLNTAASMDNASSERVRKKLEVAKGAGNFKNLYLHLPDEDKDVVKILPIAEVAAKDEFVGINNVTREDILTAHRVPPQLLGIIPQNNGGFGDIRSANDAFHRNEIEPLMAVMRQLNDELGFEAVRYREYEPQMGGSS